MSEEAKRETKEDAEGQMKRHLEDEDAEGQRKRVPSAEQDDTEGMRKRTPGLAEDDGLAQS